MVEIAFGSLKARWQRLFKQMDIHIDNVPRVITTCCVLHNFCKVHRDSFDDWLQDNNTNLDGTETESSSDDHRYSSSNNGREGVATRNGTC